MRSAVVEGLLGAGACVGAGVGSGVGAVGLELLLVIFTLFTNFTFNFLVVVVRASPMGRQRKTKQGPDNHRPTRAQ